MTNTFDSLPSDLAAAHALILTERTARSQSEARAARAEADLTHAQATASSADALIARLKLEIEKLRRTLYGARCSVCHAPHQPSEFPADRWPSLVEEMRERSKIDPAEQSLIERYLVTMAK